MNVVTKIEIRLVWKEVETAKKLIDVYRDPENGIHMEVAKDEFECDCLRVIVNLTGSNGVDIGKLLDDVAIELSQSI